MAERGYGGTWGVARTYALVFGLAYVAVALIEVITGKDNPVLIGDDTVVLAYATAHNLIHWALGVVLLGSFFAGADAARTVAKIVGLVLLAVTVLGLVAGDFTMELIGYGENTGGVPVIYTLVHGLTAVAALYAGFSGAGARAATA